MTTPIIHEPSAEALSAARQISEYLTIGFHHSTDQAKNRTAIIINAEFAALRARLERAEEALKTCESFSEEAYDDRGMTCRFRRQRFNETKVAKAVAMSPSAKPGEKEAKP